jgi:16S rRNA (uracil1498-N3)-methyltransferase
MRDGDAIEVIDSAAQRFHATVQLDGRSATAHLDALLEAGGDAGIPEIVVAQGVPKGQKMDFIVEKLTELGVAAIVPLQSERTVVSDVSPNKLERWRRLAKTAAQQCGRATIPLIEDPANLEQLLSRADAFDAVLLPWELAEPVPLRERLPALLEGAKRVLLIVGPEGGFSHAEAAAAQAAGAHAISLGKRILRTETAGLAAVAVIGYATEMRV